MSNSETAKKKSDFWAVKSAAEFIGILGFILALVIFVKPLIFPARAELTIFIDHFEFTSSSGSNSTDFTVFINIVNDGPKSANILSWNFSLTIGMPYQILSQTASRSPPLVLTTSAETDLNMSKTLIGENNTPIPNDKFQSILITIQYEDDIGVLKASRSYAFPQN